MLKFRIYLFVFAVFLSLLATLSTTAAAELKIVYNVGVAPLKFEDAASRPAGLFPDLWRLWAQKAGRKIEFVRADSFKESLQLLKDGRVDLHAGLFRTPEREEFLDYSEQLLALDYYIFTHPSVYPIKSLEKTSGFLVGIQKGGYTEKLVRSKISATRIEVYDRFQDLFRAALEGEIRVFVATELSLLYFLKENFQANIFEYDRDRPLFSQVYYTATKKGYPALIQQVNEGLKAIGPVERKQLEDRWVVRDFKESPQEMAATRSEPEKIVLTDAEKKWLTAHPVIRVATEDLPPYAFQENDEAYGYTVDLMQMMAKEAGFQFDIEFLTHAEVRAAIKNNEVELTLNQGYSEERAAYLIFGAYPFRVKTAIFSKTDRTDVHNLETLAGKTCAGPKDSVIARIIQEKYPQIRIIPTDSMFDALKMVSVGKADAAIIESNMGQYLLKKYDIIDVHLAGFANLFGAEGARASYWAVAKGLSVLNSILDKAYDSLDREGRQRLWNKWFQFDVAAAGPEPQKRINLTEPENAWLREHPLIRVHNEKDWPPFNYFEFDSPRGLSIDYMNQMAAKLGIQVEYITGPSWNEFLEMVKRKELDVMLNIVKTEDRMKYLLYTDPYIKNPNVIVSSENNPYETIEALFGKTVAFPKGFFYEEVLTQSFPQIKRLPVEDTLASLKVVTFGRADAALGEAAVMRTLINKNLLTGLRISGEVTIGNPDLTNLRIGVRDDWPLLQSALMKAMAAVTPQEMNQIRQKWLVVDEPPATRQTAVPISYGRLIGYGIAVFLILSLVTWILIKVAKKEQFAVSFGSRWFRGLVLAGLSFFVIIVCLLGWFTLDENKEQILTGVGEDLSKTLITADDRLNFWVEKRAASLKLLGRDPELVTLIKRLLAVKADRESLLASDALRDTRAFVKNNKDVFSNIGFFIINADRVSIGSMRDANIGTPNLISVQRPDLLKRSFAGEVLFVPPIESDIPLGEGTQAEGARNSSTKFFMGPIRDPSGQILAVMTLRVDPSQEFSQLLPPSITHKTGETYAFSEHGEMLSESRFGDLLRRIGLIGEDQQSALNVAIRDPGVNLVAGQRPKIERSRQPLTRMASGAIQLKANMALSGQTKGHSKIEIDTKGYRDYRGVPVFGAWLWNADLGLGLATEIDVSEAMSDYYQIRWTVFGVLGVTLFLSVSAVLLVLILGERTSHALMKARDNLEAKVDERTAELQENQKQLEAAVERSSLILDSAGEGIFGVDLDGKLAFINPAADRMLGYGPDELIGKEVHAIIHHSHADGSVYPKEECPMYLTHVDGTAHHVSDEVLWHKDGTPFPVEYTSMPIKKNGRVVGAVVTFMDITERKKMETALLAERERLQKILDNSPVGVGISTEGVVRFANQRFAELFDRKEGEAAQAAYVNPQDRAYIVKELERSGIVRDYELQTYGRNREIRDTLATFISTEYEGQTGILSWMVDLGGIKEAERELKAKFDELARFRRLAIGREQKMIELKKEINEFLKLTGNSEKYKIH